MFFVYKVTGPTGVYIGKATKPKNRWYAHKQAAKKEDSRFYRAIKKHGSEQFTLDVLLGCPNESDSYRCEQLIIAQERQYGTELYNVSAGGDGPWGRQLSAETKAKIGAANRGRKHTLESRAKISASLRALPPEIKAKGREKRKGRKRPDQAARMRGYRHSPETLDKLRNRSPETLEKCRLANLKRKPWTDEQKQRVSDAKKAWWAKRSQEERLEVLRPAHEACR